MQIRYVLLAAAPALAVATACGPSTSQRADAAPVRVAGAVYTVRDTSVQATLHADGVAEPIRQATLGTKLMGTVLAVPVREGEHVPEGAVLARIDARDVAAKQAQVTAAIADAEAARRDAATQAGRIRALYADSAATRAQLDAVETGLARANAGVSAARASAAEVSAMGSYAIIRAPFAGTVTRRFVDPGAFAAPGAPLVTVQDGSQLRISASTTPDVARMLRVGQVLDAVVEGRAVPARIEGIVPAAAGNLYAVNALVANDGGTLLPGSTATLLIPQGTQVVRVVPARAVTRTGDLTGVTVRTPDGNVVRWVQLGDTTGDMVVVSTGLRAGDRVIVPSGGR